LRVVKDEARYDLIRRAESLIERCVVVQAKIAAEDVEGSLYGCHEGLSLA
jgi:hypothetical protein